MNLFHKWLLLSVVAVSVAAVETSAKGGSFCSSTKLEVLRAETFQPSGVSDPGRKN